MIMQFIFHKTPDPFLDMCDSCEKIIYDVGYMCRYRDDYCLCKDCLAKDGDIHARLHARNVKEF